MTVKQLFGHIGIQNFKCVEWGRTFMCSTPGLYIISTSGSPDKETVNTASEPCFSDESINNWIKRLPDFTIDGVRPTPDIVKSRLKKFWLPSENVVYIGQTGTDLGKRVNAYYRTPLGDKRPHSGGQWIKTLENIDRLFVYYASVPSKTEARNLESRLLAFFESETGMLPFANLEGGLTGRKPHGMKNQREK